MEKWEKKYEKHQHGGEESVFTGSWILVDFMWSLGATAKSIDICPVDEYGSKKVHTYPAKITAFAKYKD